MKPEDIDEMWRYAYIEKCDCGKDIVVFTQRCNYPEYDTIIYVKCDCEEYVEFILPVN